MKQLTSADDDTDDEDTEHEDAGDEATGPKVRGGDDTSGRIDGEDDPQKDGTEKSRGRDGRHGLPTAPSENLPLASCREQRPVLMHPPGDSGGLVGQPAGDQVLALANPQSPNPRQSDRTLLSADGNDVPAGTDSFTTQMAIARPGTSERCATTGDCFWYTAVGWNATDQFRALSPFAAGGHFGIINGASVSGNTNGQFLFESSYYVKVSQSACVDVLPSWTSLRRTVWLPDPSGDTNKDRCFVGGAVPLAGAAPLEKSISLTFYRTGQFSAFNIAFSKWAFVADGKFVQEFIVPGEFVKGFVPFTEIYELNPDPCQTDFTGAAFSSPTYTTVSTAGPWRFRFGLADYETLLPENGYTSYCTNTTWLRFGDNSINNMSPVWFDTRNVTSVFNTCPESPNRLICRNEWIFPTGGPSPIGALDAVEVVPSALAGCFPGANCAGVRVRGWALDPSPYPATPTVVVQVYFDGVPLNFAASQPRPDVEAAYPGFGANHGYSLVHKQPYGTHQVCVIALNQGAGHDVTLGCMSITLTGNPFGRLDSATAVNGGVAVAGWAIDPDSASPIQVHVYVDGVGAAILSAGDSRLDVGAAFPDYGANHGYALGYLYARPGAHRVCTYGINVGPGGNVLLGCLDVTVSGDPFGNLESARPAPAGVRVTGWAIDPDTAASIQVHAYIFNQTTCLLQNGGCGVGIATANLARGDVAAAYPNFGANHGYSFVVNPNQGAVDETVCVFGINVLGGGNKLVGCLPITVTGNPFGHLDSVTTAPGGMLKVRGWAIDPDTDAAIQVHVYIDGVGDGVIVANQTRNDVGGPAGLYPDFSAGHGFDALVALPNTSITNPTAQVCAYGINSFGTLGGNALLDPPGCVTVDLSGNPIGHLDVVTGAVGTVTLRGWSIDPDTDAPDTVHVYSNGIGIAIVTANTTIRDDVGGPTGLYPNYGTLHGFDVTISAFFGLNQVCVYGINITRTGGSVLLPDGCVNVFVSGSALLAGQVGGPAPLAGQTTIRDDFNRPDETELSFTSSPMVPWAQRGAGCGTVGVVNQHASQTSTGVDCTIGGVGATVLNSTGYSDNFYINGTWVGGLSTPARPGLVAYLGDPVGTSCLLFIYDPGEWALRGCLTPTGVTSTAAPPGNGDVELRLEIRNGVATGFVNNQPVVSLTVPTVLMTETRHGFGISQTTPPYPAAFDNFELGPLP